MESFNYIYPEEADTQPLDSFIESGDFQFPAKVAERYPECKRLYVRGDESVLQNGIAVIGARKATPYGLRAAALIGQWAAELGFTVFSGCARGCDQAAQRSALKHGGKVVGVMGCGADVVYPSNAQDLLRNIVNNGALISEYEWGAPPMKYRFRQRNKLLAALSSLVVVTEARIPSGTFSAVNHAVDMGTPVAAIPGSIFSYDSAGPNRIISDGAYTIASRDDFLVACSLTSASANSQKPMQPPFEEDPLIKLLRSDAYFPEDVAQCLKLDVLETVSLLNGLEVEGKATRYPDGRFSSLY